MNHVARVAVESDVDIVAARQIGRDMAAEMGFSLTDMTLIATAISEVARNITTYAGSGEICCEVVDEEGKQALLVTATDAGPGIVDVDRALQDGYSTGQGMGLGLPGAKRLMDDFEIRSEPGEGTTVVMRKWLQSRD